MSDRLIQQVAEVITRRLIHGDAACEATATALNLMQSILQEDYPELHGEAVGEAMKELKLAAR